MGAEYLSEKMAGLYDACLAAMPPLLISLTPALAAQRAARAAPFPSYLEIYKLLRQ